MDVRTDIVQEMSTPIYQAKGWIKLVGVMSIVYGVLAALSIVGLLIAWLPIWMGVILMKSASSIEEAHLRGQKEAMLVSMGKLKTYFVIMGVLTLIGLVLTLLGFVFGLFGAVMQHMQMQT